MSDLETRANGQNASMETRVVYRVGVTPTKGASLHYTTDGQSSLCNRPLVDVRGEREGDLERTCGPCQKSRAIGSVSPVGGRRVDVVRRLSKPVARPRSALEEKAAELESLATEIRELREREKAAIARFEQLRQEFTKFLGSISISAT